MRLSPAHGPRQRQRAGTGKLDARRNDHHLGVARLVALGRGGRDALRHGHVPVELSVQRPVEPERGVPAPASALRRGGMCEVLRADDEAPTQRPEQHPGERGPAVVEVDDRRWLGGDVLRDCADPRSRAAAGGGMHRDTRRHRLGTQAISGRGQASSAMHPSVRSSRRRRTTCRSMPA